MFIEKSFLRIPRYIDQDPFYQITVELNAMRQIQYMQNKKDVKHRENLTFLMFDPFYKVSFYETTLHQTKSCGLFRVCFNKDPQY